VAGSGYKVVEVSPVGEDTLERALDRWTAEGFDFQSIHFVMREGSHRPAMAYLFFLGRRDEGRQDQDPRGEGRGGPRFAGEGG